MMNENKLIILLTCILIQACTSVDKKAVEQQGNEERNRDTLTAMKKETLYDTANYTTIQWLDSTYKKLGQLKVGKQVDLSFRFKNTGDKPLTIFNVTAACGCTVPEQHHQSYAPGEIGIIRAAFNSEGFERFLHKELHKEIYIRAGIKPDILDTLTFSLTLIE